MTFPTVHLNGTSADSLLTQLCDAMTAIEAAMQAVANAAPNARDYEPEGFYTAQDEHFARLEALRAVRLSLDLVAANVSEQQSAREAIKRGAR